MPSILLSTNHINQVLPIVASFLDELALDHQPANDPDTYYESLTFSLDFSQLALIINIYIETYIKLIHTCIKLMHTFSSMFCHVALPFFYLVPPVSCWCLAGDSTCLPPRVHSVSGSPVQLLPA